jgi:chemotaxis signal transduction protein
MSEHIEPGSGKPDSDKRSSAQLLTFMVDEQEYGVDILRVQEIRGWSAPMPIPGAPPYIKGVINIRGDASVCLRWSTDRPPPSWCCACSIAVASG